MVIMVRGTANSAGACRIANAMEAAGAEVFSVTDSGRKMDYLGFIAIDRFLIWARVRDEAHMTEVDRAIDGE